jgi:hypothetical protein
MYSSDREMSSVWVTNSVNSNGVVQTPSRQVLVSNWFDSKSGQSVPKFRSLIRAKSDATSPYSRNNNNVVGLKPFYLSQVIDFPLTDPLKKKYAESVMGLYRPSLPSLGTNTINADIDAQALAKVYRKLSAQQSHANGMQFLGEFHEVVKMFKHPYQGARKLVENYLSDATKYGKRFRPFRSKNGRKSFNKAVADSWLETAFGLKPLISDSKELAEAAARFSRDTRRDRVSGASEGPVSASELKTNVGGLGTNFCWVTMQELNQVVHSVRYTAFLDWHRSGAFGSYERLVELFGFRLDKFIPTLYELTPWSFLVDYFTNLGTVIETGCQCQTVVSFVVKGTKVIATRQSLTTATLDPLTTGARILSTVSGPGRIKQIRTSYARSRWSSLPNIPLRLDLPGKPMQYANMLALWASKSAAVGK